MANVDINELRRNLPDIELTPDEVENVLARFDARGGEFLKIRKNHEYLMFKPKNDALRRGLGKCGISYEHLVRGEVPPLTPEQCSIVLEEYAPYLAPKVKEYPWRKPDDKQPKKENPSE